MGNHTKVLNLLTSGSILVTAVSTGKLLLAFDFPNTLFIDHGDKHVIEQLVREIGNDGTPYSLHIHCSIPGAFLARRL